jgi:malonate decarboxylase epsilon subunit
MSLTLLFPGQGSESEGMLSRLPSVPAVKATFRAAEEVLKVPVESLDTEAALAQTTNAQVALFIAGVAAARWLFTAEIKPQFVAGHSIGAFTAAVTAGVLSFEQGLELVIKRAESMVQAAPKDSGMAVLAGAPVPWMEQMVSAAAVPIGSLYVANRNAPDQMIIAGKLSAIEAVLRMGRARGLRRAHLLRLSVPSHTPWMEPVAEILLQVTQRIKTFPPLFPCGSNISGRLLYKSSEIIEDLVWGVARPVNWTDCMNALYEAGTRLFLEIPPGNVQTRIASNRFPDTRAYSVEGMSIGSVLKAVASV